MSRIPVPATHNLSPSNSRSGGATSPIPFPDRASSPLPTQSRQNSRSNASAGAPMSTLSGFQLVSETRKKQSKRDEVGLLRRCYCFVFFSVVSHVFFHAFLRVRTGFILILSSVPGNPQKNRRRTLAKADNIDY